MKAAGNGAEKKKAGHARLLSSGHDPLVRMNSNVLTDYLLGLSAFVNYYVCFAVLCGVDLAPENVVDGFNLVVGIGLVVLDACYCTARHGERVVADYFEVG